MGEVTISTTEYRNLLEAQARIEIFSQFVRRTRYSISKEECAYHLGFELENQDED